MILYYRNKKEPEVYLRAGVFNPLAIKAEETIRAIWLDEEEDLKTAIYAVVRHNHKNKNEKRKQTE